MNRLLDKQIVEVALSDAGAGISITVVDTYDPAQRAVLRCNDIVILQWHRTPPDEPPYFIPELYWREVDLGEIKESLFQLRYSFFNDVESALLGEPAIPAGDIAWSRFDHSLIHLHIEGAICADIICSRLDVQ